MVLLRHGKSGYPDGVADHDRPLAPRGERQAALAGAWLRRHALEDGALSGPVAAVLCSSATRTQQTLAHTEIDAPAVVADVLYGAGPGTVIAQINGAVETFGFDPDVLLVVGHEPTMSALTLGLSGADGTDHGAAQQVSMGFPTSAMAVLQFDGPWSGVELGSGALRAFHVPR